MAASYFKGEGVDIFGSIIRLICGKRKDQTHLKTITIGHLEKAVKVGRLDDEILNN